MTQVQGEVPRPVSFLSRYLTKTELKWGEIERTVSLVSWALRKLRRYSTYAQQITVIVPWEETRLVILEKQQHIRLKALLIELGMYRVHWKVGVNKWELGGPVFKETPATVP
jgi:RNase H-like domain found in reverse transcriptase